MKKYIQILLSLLIALTTVIAPLSHQAAALSGADWRAGRIVDDAVFTNPYAMTVSEIQDFLNARVPTCDTWGTQPSEYGGGTRANYAASRGNPVPFTCLKEYYEVPKTSPSPNEPASNYGGKSIPSGAQSAAKIIANAAIKYNINPQVLLVKLATESPGPLTSDDWPFKRQYLYAMGAHCPDSGPNGSANCDINYSGFSMQMDEAAGLLRWYLDSMTQSWWQYKKPYQVNNILWNVAERGCGGGDIYIESKATAALYTYTPYQPNKAALDNLYGSGDYCSAYGNRNFWRVFNDWFNPAEAVQRGITMNIVAAPDSTPARGQTVSYTVAFTNKLSENITLNSIGVVGRLDDLSSGANRDFGWVGPVTLQPNQPQQFTFTSTVTDSGKIYAWPAVNYKGTYVHYNNWGSLLEIHEPKLSLISPLSPVSSDNVTVGETPTFSATIRNDEDQAIKIGSFGIPIRYYDTYNYDAAWSAPSGNTLAAGASYTVSGSTKFDKPGPYSAWISWVLNGRYSTLSSINTYKATSSTPSFTLSYLETPNPSPALGEDVFIKFKLKNNRSVPMTLDAVGVVGRYDDPYNGPNRDFGWIGPETFAANEEKSYTTLASNVTELKNFYAWVAINYKGTYSHYNNWGFMMKPRTPNLTLRAPLMVNNGTTPTRGQTATVTASVKNNEPKPIRFSALGIPARFYNRYNYDATWVGQNNFAPAGSTGDTVNLSGSITFDKAGPYTVWTSLNVANRYITVGQPIDIQVK